MASKRAARKPVEHDDLTFATMGTEEEAAPPRRRKAKKEEARTDPWEAVAAECPVRVSAAAHKANPSRVHITCANGPILCVQGVQVERNRYLPDPMPSGWRTSDAYRRAEL